MDMFLCCIVLICFYVILIRDVTRGAVNSNPFLTRNQSAAFLDWSPHKRVIRESESPDFCRSHPCVNGATCNSSGTGFTCTCAPSWTGALCTDDINECNSSPCQYGGTCTDQWKGHSCKCIAGITGHNCEINIDECASNPCQNNATCNDGINRYYCKCPPRIYGVNCDTNICHPTPADVVFVLDSSVSMSESQFHKQLEFVANFSDHVIIGPRDFQISVITFSFDAHIEFFLNQYTDNATLKEAVTNITYKPGATFTNKGLKAVKTVFSAGHGIERRVNNTQADRFVYLLTDGMSSDILKTKEEAHYIKDNYGVQLTAVGIGSMVSHSQLVEIASQHDGLPNLYSVNDFNSLYTLLKQLVHYDCDECEHSSMSDIALVIDTSYNVTVDQYQASINAVIHLIDLMDLAVDKARVSVTTFDTTASELFGFLNHTNKDMIKSKVSRIVQSREIHKMSIVDILDFVDINVLSSARPNARNFIICFTNGNFENVDSVRLQQAKTKLKSDNVITVAIGSGNDVNLDGLISLVADSYHVFLTMPNEQPVNLDVLKSDFVYNTCDLKNE